MIAIKLAYRAECYPGFFKAETLSGLRFIDASDTICQGDFSPVVLADGSLRVCRWSSAPRGNVGTGGEARRCLVPIAGYYHWVGNELFHFEARDGGWLWAAGLHSAASSGEDSFYFFDPLGRAWDGLPKFPAPGSELDFLESRSATPHLHQPELRRSPARRNLC